MHTRPTPGSDGESRKEWRSARAGGRADRCRCGSADIWYRAWEPSCGGPEGTRYVCRACKRAWWVAGPDG